MFLPGCPPSADLIYTLLDDLLSGRTPDGRRRPVRALREPDMSQTITIDPVTRIEGHSKITIQLDDRGEVADAHFHVTQFRGFERITQGRPVHEMPAIMARICGICPVSHLVASAKAVDDIMAVEPTPTGADLRRIINLGQIVQSNALSFFHLSSPDLLFGFDADPAIRNIVGVARKNPQLAQDGIGLRKWGQQIIEWLGGKRIHPTGIVPGGVAFQLTAEVRDRILAGVPEAIAATERAIAWYKQDMIRWEEEAATFGNFRSAFMGLVDREGNVDHYGGWMRVVDADGHFLADKIDPKAFNDYIGEAVEPWSYLKTTYWKPMGYPDGIYRVGPLARLNVADRCGTPARRRGAGEVPLARRAGRGLVLPLPLRAPDRHAQRDREDRGAAPRARTSSSKHTRSWPASTATRASACPRPRAAR